MKKYTCKPGNHDFSPPQTPRVFAVKQNIFDRVANWEFEFTESCWFDWRLPGGTTDQDVFDQNFKLCGWCPVLQPGNLNGVMFAATTNPEIKNQLDFCFYQNLDGKFIIRPAFSKIITEKTPWRLHVRLRRESKKRLEMSVFVQEHGERKAKLVKSFGFDMAQDYAIYREIFLWFGGENNSEGEFGGTPSKDIVLSANRY